MIVKNEILLSYNGKEYWNIMLGNGILGKSKINNVVLKIIFFHLHVAKTERP